MLSYTESKKKCGRKNMIKVLPSTNPCPEDKLLDYTKMLMDLGVEYLHCDVMDGKFVENKCLDFSLVEKIRNNTNILLDVHLMVEEPLKFVDSFLEAGADYITVHYEVFKSIEDLKKAISYIKFKGLKVGVSIKP